MESGFFSQNYRYNQYDSKNPKNVNDRIYNEYIKFCIDNKEVSDPNKIIQMLALKQKILPTTDGTDHNLNNYIDSWIQDKMLSLIGKFIPNPTSKNIEIFADRLCKYLEVMDICTQKNIKLKSIDESLKNKIDSISGFDTKKKYIDTGYNQFGQKEYSTRVMDLDARSFDKIIVSIDLQEKFKKIRSLMNKLEKQYHFFSTFGFDKLCDYIIKSPINEKTRSSSFKKTTDSIHGEKATAYKAKKLENQLKVKLEEFQKKPLKREDIVSIISDLKEQAKGMDSEINWNDCYLFKSLDNNLTESKTNLYFESSRIHCQRISKRIKVVEIQSDQNYRRL